MILKHQIVTFGTSALFLLLVLNLLRKNKMKEIYSILWFVVGLIFIVISLWEGLLTRLTELIGAKYPASVLFFFGLIFVLILLVHFSVEISTLRKHAKDLNQSLAILNNELAALKKNFGPKA